VLDLDTLIYRDDLPGEKRAGDLVKPALYVDEDLRLEIALQRMQRGGQRLAIVLGRDRRETGIVTLEDILKVVFGEVTLDMNASEIMADAFKLLAVVLLVLLNGFFCGGGTGAGAHPQHATGRAGAEGPSPGEEPPGTSSNT